MQLKTGLGLTPMRKNTSSPCIKSYNFAQMTTLPPDLTNLRSGGAWYQDDHGLIHKVTESNTIRFGTIYGSARGALVEVTVTAANLYSRPSAGDVSDHFSSGTSIATIDTDTDSLCKNLTNGNNIWVFDNRSGAEAVDINFHGTLASGRVSAMAYIKTISGEDAVLSISGNGSDQIGHNVNGYSLHRTEDVFLSASAAMRITIPAGALIHVACANFQAYDFMTSFIDTSGSTLTRNNDDLNGTDASWWAGIQEGTFFVDCTYLDDTGQSGHLFEIRDTDVTQRFTIWQNGGLCQTSMEVDNTNIFNSNSPVLINRTRLRIACAYKAGEFLQMRNGELDLSLTPANVPDTSTFAASTNPISFFSVNRSGAAPLNGIVHGFALYNQAFTANKLQKLTSPNNNNELWVALFGDSNLERWKSLFDGRPQQSFVDALGEHYNGSIHVINKGQSASAANYTGAAAHDVDYWSNDGDTNGGNAWYKAMGPGTTGGSVIDDTCYQKQKIDYVIINLAAADIKSLTSGIITKAAYKASFLNVLDVTSQNLGAQVKYIIQYPPSANSVEYNDAAMQDARDALREIAQSDPRVIGAYELYDITRTDNVHGDEAAYTTAASRAANIINADLKRTPKISSPEVVNATHNGNTLTMTTNAAAALSGDARDIFRVEINGSPTTITNVFCSGQKVTLVLSETITDTDDVRLWVGYGQMSSLDPARCIIDSENGYPMNSLANYEVTLA